MPLLRQYPFLWFLLWMILLGYSLGPTFWVIPNPDGDAIVRRTVRVALLFWAWAIACRIQSGPRSARWLWTLACLAYLIHVAMAFHHVHDWSHENAFHHVEQISGYGAGIFVSYTFTLLWFLDVLIQWLLSHPIPNWYQRWSRILHPFMLFILINGAILYEPGWIRYASLTGLLVLGWLWRRSKRVFEQRSG